MRLRCLNSVQFNRDDTSSMSRPICGISNGRIPKVDSVKGELVLGTQLLTFANDGAAKYANAIRGSRMREVAILFGQSKLITNFKVQC